jgi:hypothetical protein
MTTSEFVAATILKATGEVSTAVSGDSEWEKVRGIGNFYIPQWAREPNVDWNSLYDPESEIGTVTADSTYELEDDIYKLSDRAGDVVRIDHTDGVGFTTYQIVKADELKRYYEGNKASSYGNVCAQVGRDLVFNHTFTSTDTQYSGTIKVPIYIEPDLLSGDSSTVPIDDPNWLVLMAAAEYVRNDITLQGQYGNLIAEANQAMQRMKDDNDTAQYMEIVRSPAGAGMTW